MCFCFTAQAEIVKCDGSLNSDQSFQTSVDISEGKKVRVESLGENKIFLSLKKEIYSIEVYNPTKESRFYSEGTITETNNLSFHFWTREDLLSIKCFK